MIDNGLIKPSINMLPMEEIESALARKVIAQDTTLVGEVNASEIAIAVTQDRMTVYNALNLNGIPANQFLTKQNDPFKLIDDLNKDYQSEVTSLRLELYRMYEILNKQLGATYTPENGFLENFIDLYTTSINASVVGLTGTISEIRPDDYYFAITNELIVVEASIIVNGKFETRQYVTKIKSCNPQTNTYILDGEINSKDLSVKLYKIKGEFLNNTFSFSETSINGISEKDHTVLLGDYATYSKESIGTGIATSIQLQPDMITIDGLGDKALLNTVRAYITREQFSASTQLICKIYEINNSVSNLTLLGQSTYQDITSSGWFMFNIEKDGLPIEVTGTMKILVAFECNGAPVYSIRVGRGTTGDLHTNRQVYVRTNNEFGFSYELSSTNDYDLLVGLIFKNYVPQVTIPYTSGLYTSKIFINEKPNNRLVKAHIKLNKIPTARVQSNGPADSFNGIVVSNSINGTGRMVIGNNILTCNTKNNDMISTLEHAAIYPNDIVYFIPCQMQIVASSELFDQKQVKTVVPLDCIGVTGDYLLYQCLLPENTKRYQLQIRYDDATNIQAAALDSISVSIV